MIAVKKFLFSCIQESIQATDVPPNTAISDKAFIDDNLITSKKTRREEINIVIIHKNRPKIQLKKNRSTFLFTFVFFDDDLSIYFTSKRYH